MCIKYNTHCTRLQRGDGWDGYFSFITILNFPSFSLTHTPLALIITTSSRPCRFSGRLRATAVIVVRQVNNILSANLPPFFRFS